MFVSLCFVLEQTVMSTPGYQQHSLPEIQLVKGLRHFPEEIASEIWDSELNNQNVKNNTPEQGKVTGISIISEK